MSKVTIAGRFSLDPTQSGPLAIAGTRGFAALDARDSSRRLLALEALADRPPRAEFLSARAAPTPHCLSPIEHGAGLTPDGKHAWFTICPAPPGPALSPGARVWRENELIGCVLIPSAQALVALAERNLTHRALRPDNIFQSAPNHPVTLGPAFATPPGSDQPAAFEPPDLVWCLPAGRGEGTIADDVYALGVTILALATGRVPLEGLPSTELARLIHEHGPFDALAGTAALSPFLTDLLRAMLAEDREHRPSPALLLQPDAARNRRPPVRTVRRAIRPLDLPDISAWSARDAAFALARHPERAIALIHSGALDRWLRRSLADPALATRLEVALRIKPGDPEGDTPRAQALLLLRAVAILDPTAPLVWRGIALQPSGLGPALAGAETETDIKLEELAATEILATWAEARPLSSDERDRLIALSKSCRLAHQQRGPAGGIRRILYTLNPLLPCASPLLSGRIVVRLADLLPVIDAVAEAADQAAPPLDPHLAAFIAARAEAGITAELDRLGGLSSPSERLAVGRLFARLQSRLGPEKAPGLAAWLLASGCFGVDRFRERRARADMEQHLMTLAQHGNLDALFAVVDAPERISADRQAAARAEARRAAIDRALNQLAAHATQRREAAARLGQEIATGAGVLAAASALLRLVIAA